MLGKAPILAMLAVLAAGAVLLLPALADSPPPVPRPVELRDDQPERKAPPSKRETKRRDRQRSADSRSGSPPSATPAPAPPPEPPPEPQPPPPPTPVPVPQEDDDDGGDDDASEGSDD